MARPTPGWDGVTARNSHKSPHVEHKHNREKNVVRPCIQCKEDFDSWDRVYNQICERCRRLSGDSKIRVARMMTMKTRG